jgi:RND family efflux transporter MFP subunit
LKLAQNALGYSKLVSDADGVVTSALVEPGQVVGAGQVVMRVARTNEREALAAIPETLVERIRTGTATLALWSSPDKSTRAVLRELSPAADAATRTYAARFSLPDVGAEMAWGMTATVTVADAVTSTGARLPLSALFNEGKGPSLWVVDKTSGALTLKPVDVAKIDGSFVYIRSGVAEGDDVVTLGVQKLDTGQKVRVVSALGT